MTTQKTILFVFLSYFFSNLVHAGRLPETIVKIGILSKQDSVNIGCTGTYYICNMETGDTECLIDNDIRLFKVTKEGFSYKDKTIVSSLIRLTPKSHDSPVLVNGKGYFDSIILKKIKDKITVINELGIESYLGGILTREVDPAWPLEALKAQAVVSRSFTMANIGKHSKEGHDLCNTVHCQVYGGLAGYDKRTNRAVAETKGEVLVSNGRIVNAIYHACCAGHTANICEVWPGDNPNAPSCLAGTKCIYCTKSPHYNWAVNLDENTIRKKLNGAGYSNISVIRKIKSRGKDKSGRVSKIDIIYKNKKANLETLTLSSSKFRMIASPFTIKSTKIVSIEKLTGDKFRFVGHGWGHGVGMCQWGAKGMADKGFNYNDILKYYYPSTKIEKWED